MLSSPKCNVLEVFLKHLQTMYFYLPILQYFLFSKSPRIKQTARYQFHEMYLGNRLIQIDSLSIVLCDNREHDHFILNEYDTL